MDRNPQRRRVPHGQPGRVDPQARWHRARLHLAQAAGFLVAVTATHAQPAASAAHPSAHGDWQRCTALDRDPEARLACFDQWARKQHASEMAASAPPSAPAPAIAVARTPGCGDSRHSDLSRFWELETGSACNTFRIRGYRPISLSVIGSDSVNTQPTSANPLNNAPTALPYRHTETRIQLSVRTKLAEGLLTQGQPTARDSLWFGYTQQSYWQLFNPGLSRPFRVTDHEPEFVYVYPTDAPLPGGWRLRYSGLGVVHQSNGQSLPYSRSWNRVYLMSGMERGNDLRVQARIWGRVPEKSANDDNPDISRHVGRAELSAFWNPDTHHTLGFTLRHTLSTAARGSVRLEWLRALGNGAATGAASGLRLHTQLFSGYGDSLLDYNRRRTVLSVGLSLVDF